MNEQEVKVLIDKTIHCPIDAAFKVMGKKFTMHILRNMLLLKQKRFNEFAQSIEGINSNTLSMRLKEMERHGLIDRKIYPETPIRIEYFVAEKGQALLPVLEQMIAFTCQYYPEVVFKDGKSRTFKDVIGRSTKRIG